MVSAAAKKYLALEKFDIKTSSLYCELNENTFITVSQVYDEKGKVCNYELKQAPMK